MLKISKKNNAKADKKITQNCLKVLRYQEFRGMMFVSVKRRKESKCH